jgi:hypothetical protein
MSEIKAGDLVMVIRPRVCCGNTRALGLIATVSSRRLPKIVRCRSCGFSDLASDAIYVPLSDGFECERSRLIKIDPPAESTGEQDTRRIKETA